ncbi:hypothetical protein SASPL_104766 [Salvia splendens]|uniref:Uncharacterized protein n=1 Tax=Salvia splendens TaxID=180675 RepID=A0A8X8YP79_SALSN|nr:hypothetical protein SASPL_104766 [Salvia splendens]
MEVIYRGVRGYAMVAEMQLLVGMAGTAFAGVGMAAGGGVLDDHLRVRGDVADVVHGDGGDGFPDDVADERDMHDGAAGAQCGQRGGGLRGRVRGSEGGGDGAVRLGVLAELSVQSGTVAVGNSADNPTKQSSTVSWWPTLACCTRGRRIGAGGKWTGIAALRQRTTSVGRVDQVRAATEGAWLLPYAHAHSIGSLVWHANRGYISTLQLLNSVASFRMLAISLAMNED